MILLKGIAQMDHKTVLILTVLAQTGGTHGYTIMKRLDDAGFPISAGTLYRHLAAAVQAGWISLVARESSDTRRQYYEITPAGQEQLIGEVDRLRRMLKFIEAESW
jgi:DNA-binding PadR family transcriptional regulator